MSEDYIVPRSQEYYAEKIKAKLAGFGVTSGEPPTRDGVAELVKSSEAIRPERRAAYAEIIFGRTSLGSGDPAIDALSDRSIDRAHEAQAWCERIMVQERRERLLESFYGTDSDWLVNRMRNVVDSWVSWNPSHSPSLCLSDFDGDANRYRMDLSGPLQLHAGVILGHIAASPQIPVVFTGRDDLTPLSFHGFLKHDKEHVERTCDLRISTACENRRRYILAFPLGNSIIYFVTCNPCCNELPNYI